MVYVDDVLRKKGSVRVKSTSQAVKQLGNYNEWRPNFHGTMYDHLLLERAFVLPREIPTFVQPHLFKVKRTLLELLPGFEAFPKQVAIVQHPDVSNTLSIGVLQSSDQNSQVLVAETNDVQNDFHWASANGICYSFDDNLHLTL